MKQVVIALEVLDSSGNLTENIQNRVKKAGEIANGSDAFTFSSRYIEQASVVGSRWFLEFEAANV